MRVLNLTLTVSSDWIVIYFEVAVFITSEGVFFLTLIITYIAYRGESTSGPSPQQVLNVPVASFFTVFLLASSITMAKVTSQLNAR